MNSYELVHDIKENQELFSSFNTLAEKTFEINFAKWHDLGYWNEKYIPYAFTHNQEVIANASVTTSELVTRDKTYQVIQIGTVMTKKEYQKQGLSRKLIEQIITDYQDKVDFIYLFANETVLDFYPKFGFKRRDELMIEINPKQIKKFNEGILKIEFADKKTDIEEKAKQRNNQHLVTYLTDIDQLTLFYYSTAFEEMIFYIEELDTYVCFEIEDKELHLFDILSEKEVNVKEILSFLPLETIEKIYCHFELKEMADLEITTSVIPMDDNALFIFGELEQKIEAFKFPLISHA